MDNLELDVDFILNNPEVKANTERIKNDVQGVGTTAEQASQKVAESVENMVKPQIGLLERLKTKLKEYQEQAAKATSVTGVEKANAKIQDFEQEIKRLTNIGKQGFDDLGNKIKDSLEKPVGTLNRLKAAAKGYGDMAASSTNPEIIAKYNRKLQDTEAQIKKLSNAGKEGFDNLGNKINRVAGYQEELTKKIRNYQNVIAKQPNSDLGAKNIANLNKRLEQATNELNRLKNAGKTGFDELGNKIPKVTEQSGGLLSSIRSIGAALGITFGLNLLRQWGVELFGIANKASGIERAFSAIGDSGALDKLRNETKNFVTDLELEKLTVQAKNLNVPIDNLGTYLMFAAQRAKDTGADVKQLTNDIINGLGRESPRVIDNLGISQKELNKEIAKTGNFAQAVSNIMVRSMNEAGVAVDTLADKTNRLSSWWDNLKAKAAGFFAETFAPDVADNKIIGNLTAQTLKSMGDLNKKSQDERSKSIADQKKQIAELSKAYQAASKEFDKPTKGGLTGFAAADKKEAGERLAAAQNVLKTLNEIDRKQSVKERQGKGVYNINELDEKIDKLTIKFKDSLDPKERENVKKQIDEATKLRDAMEGKTKKEKGVKSDDTMLSQQRALKQKIQDINNEFSRKSKVSDEGELQEIRDKFFKISKEVKEFNANPKNKYKVDGSGLDKTRDAAIEDLKYKQQTAKAEIAFDKQKKLYEDYENFRTTFGKDAADKRFGTELKTNADQLKELKASYEKLALKSAFGGGLNGGEQERLEQQEQQIKALQSIDEKRYADAYESALTYNQKIERINEEYRRKAADLGKSITEQQKANLSKQRDEAINIANDEALAKTDIYKKLAENTFETSNTELKEGAKALRSLLKDENITSDLRAKIEAELKKLDVTLNIGVNQANLESLKLKLSLLKDSLNPEKNGGIIVSPKETKRILGELSQVQNKIDNLTGSGTGKAKSNFAQGLNENFKYLKESSKQVADGVSKDLGALSGSFGELSDAVGGVNTKTGYALDTIGKLAKVGSDAAGAFSSFASGDIVGGVTKAISAVAGLFSIGKKVKEMNAAARKEVADFYANAIAGERAYQDLLKERELQTIRNNKVALQGVRDELALRKSQTADYSKEAAEIMAKLQAQSYITSESYTHGTWFRKASVDKTYGSLNGMTFQQLSSLLAQGKLEGDAKALVERLKELEQKGYDAGQAILDLAKETQEIFTGTTADKLTDTLLDMFKDGKTGAKDLADFFKSAMDDAALSIFKNKVLSAQMNKFYDEFAKASESDDSLSNSEINDLQKLFTTLTNEAKTKFEDLKKITGSDLTGSSSNSNSALSGIQGMSQQTAEVIAGQFGGQRLATLEGNQIARDNGMQAMAEMKKHFLVLVKIEDNTRRSAEEQESYLPYLKSIDTKLSNTNNAVRAAGGI